jgi:hypothetical protein
MPSYRIRTAFRIAAIAPALVLTIVGVALLVEGIRLSQQIVLGAIFLLVVGLVSVAVGAAFLRFLWTGRAPAGLEENGLSDSEIARYRSEARGRDQLVE